MAEKDVNQMHTMTAMFNDVQCDRQWIRRIQREEHDLLNKIPGTNNMYGNNL